MTSAAEIDGTVNPSLLVMVVVSSSRLSGTAIENEPVSSVTVTRPPLAAVVAGTVAGGVGESERSHDR